MIAALRQARDRFLGRGDAAVTVPPMDGALRPNRDLETAGVLTRLSRPDSLAVCGEALLATSGPALLRIDPTTGSATPEYAFTAPITAMAADRTGRLAVGLADGAVLIGRLDACAAMRPVDAAGLSCPVAMAFDGQGSLFVCQGSAFHSPQDWARDLMERRESGSVWKIAEGGTGADLIADAMAFPFGIVPFEDGVVVSESWRHRLVFIDARGRRRTLLDDLPGYPARLSASGDGYWLAVSAPRSQLIEFVLREPRFRERMLREIDPQHWLAPTRTSARSYLDPMQGGGMITHGQVKPWAPARSYGLVVRLDGAMQPVASHHSRADGRFHGVTDCVEMGGELIVASNGGDALLKLSAGSVAR
jgi:hypothetical protein